MVNYLPETCASIRRLHYTYKLSTFHLFKKEHSKYRFNLNPFYQLHYIGKFFFFFLSQRSYIIYKTAPRINARPNS